MTRYIKYRILLQEPVRIADDSSAKQGQAVTRRYIPGSTIRGHVVNALSQESYFSNIKKELFSERVRFLNAYLTVGFGKGEEAQDLLPSPKGFYEDKNETEDEKPLDNVVVQGEFNEVYKRAELGTNVMIEKRNKDDPGNPGTGGGELWKLRFFTPKVVADTKIKLGESKDQEVFRTTSIMSGHRFTGYIAMDNADFPVSGVCADNIEQSTLCDVLRKALDTPMYLGNARTSGLGKCLVEMNEVMGVEEKMPFASYAMRVSSSKESSSEESSTKNCYMMLLSDTCMRNSCGEYCGIDLPTLEKALGVQDLKIRFCSTSVSDIRGFNRHYGGAIPSVPMYEKGSVFHLVYKGILSQELLDNVMYRGIGIRRNEGYGQVLFLDGYELLSLKQKGTLKITSDATSVSAAEGKDENNPSNDEYDKVILIAAKAHYRNKVRSAIRRYVVDKPFPARQTASQMGNILSIAMANRFQPEAGWKKISAYFEHKTEKEGKARVHNVDAGKSRGSSAFKKAVSTIRDTDLNELLEISFTKPEKKEIMGIPVSKLMDVVEEKRVKIDLLIQLIRYHFKEEVKPDGENSGV